MELQKHDRLSDSFFKNINAEWAISPEIGDYIQGDIVSISQEEAEDYYDAGNNIYDMFVAAGEHILQYDRFDEMGISPVLKEIIEYTWEHDNHWHLYGRFDFAGGVDGSPIRLMEFNADTPTSLPESAVFQWAHLLDKSDDGTVSQFNTIFDGLVKNFEKLKDLNPDKEPYMLFTYMDSAEDKANVEFIAGAAKEAGFEIEFRELPEITFSDDDSEGGVWVDYGNNRYQRFDYWFKLIPWEFLAEDMSDLVQKLTTIVKNEQCIILNPAYTMLFQSKMILSVLWDLFPESEYLLKTTIDKPFGEKYVKKVIFGREGANVSIYDEFDRVIESKDGDYRNTPSIYQEYVHLNTDNDGKSYQAGVFFANEACGLGFRRGSKIMNDTAEFVSHKID